MKNFLIRKRTSFSYRIASVVICLTFIASLVTPPVTYAQTAQINLPPPGTMVTPSAAFTPPILRGLKVDPNNPLEFDLIVDSGDSGLKGDELKGETEKFARYFLAALTISEDDLWVNLSPYEKDRIISEKLGDTDLGRDLLAEDYILKQLASSLIHPESDLGKVFWDKVYAKAQELYGTTEIPINAFNRVWIVPDQAVVYEAPDGTAYVAVSHLKVMLEEDYMALNKDMAGQADPVHEKAKELSRVSSPVVREVIIPAIEKEVNEGKNFAQLRQINNAVVLAAWFKKALKQSVLGQVYADKGKTAGVDLADPTAKDKIYDQYLQAFQKGAYNYIKQDYDAFTQRTIPRKYFSGGYATKINDRTLAERTQSVPNLAALPAPVQSDMMAVQTRAAQASGNVVRGRISLGQATPAGDSAFLGRRVNTWATSLPRFERVAMPDVRAMQGQLTETPDNTLAQQHFDNTEAVRGAKTFVSVAVLPSGSDFSREAVRAAEAGFQAFTAPDLTPVQIAAINTTLQRLDADQGARFDRVRARVDSALTSVVEAVDRTPQNQRQRINREQLVTSLMTAATSDTGIFMASIRADTAPVRAFFTDAVNKYVDNQISQKELSAAARTWLESSRTNYLIPAIAVSTGIQPIGEMVDSSIKAGAAAIQISDAMPLSNFMGEPVLMPVAQATQRVTQARQEALARGSRLVISAVTAAPQARFSAGIDTFALGATRPNLTPLADVMQLAGRGNTALDLPVLQAASPALATQVNQVLDLQRGSTFGFAEPVKIDLPDLSPSLATSLQSAGDVWANSAQIESGILPVSRDTRISVSNRQTTVGALLDAKPANFPQIQTAVSALNDTWSREAGLQTYQQAVSNYIMTSNEGRFANMSPTARTAVQRSWEQAVNPLQKPVSLPQMQTLARDMGINVAWDAEVAKTPQGHYQVGSQDLNASVRARNFAPVADSIAIDMPRPDVRLAQAVVSNVQAMPQAQNISFEVGPNLSAGLTSPDMWSNTLTAPQIANIKTAMARPDFSLNDRRTWGPQANDVQAMVSAISDFKTEMARTGVNIQPGSVQVPIIAQASLTPETGGFVTSVPAAASYRSPRVDVELVKAQDALLTGTGSIAQSSPAMVFNAVLKAERPMRVADVARELKLSTATVGRTLGALDSVGVLQRNDIGAYMPTPEARNRLPEVTALVNDLPTRLTPAQRSDAAKQAVELGLNVSPTAQEDLGGINLDPGLMNLEIKRDGKGVPLPVNMQPIMNMDIQGFTPKVMDMQPVTTLPLTLSGAGNAKKTLAAK